MGTIFVARSKTISDWGYDVGLSKHLYKVGYTEEPVKNVVAAGWDGTADWSPDSARIVTGGKDAQGLAGLFMIPVDGEHAGEPTRLVDGVAINPVWSPDGSVIVYGGPFAKGQVSLFGVRPDRTPVELPPVRGKQSFDRDFCLLDARGIVLTFDHQPDFLLLKAVQYVALGNGTETRIENLADRGLFLHLYDDAPALRRLFPQELDVFEVTRVPQRVEVAFQGRGVVDIPSLGEDTCADRIGGDAPVPGDVDLRDDVTLRGRCPGCPEKHDECHQKPAGAPPHIHPKPLK